MSIKQFDVQQHMGDFAMDHNHLSREIGPRVDESRMLNRLTSIWKLVRKSKLKDSERQSLLIELKIVADSIDHMHASRFNRLSSGSNAEVIARLVGSGLLCDFPDIIDAEWGGKNTC